MHTRGLVGVVVIALGLVGYARAADELNVFDDVGSGDFTNADVSVFIDQDSDTGFQSDGWRGSLLGSRSMSHIYAGTEFTALQVESLTGGRTTLSFSDTTAPGVASVSFVDPGGIDDFAYAPRVWLGLQLTDKWGVRGRYWRLSGTDVHSPELAPGTSPSGTNFATIFTTDHVEAWNADFEVVRSAEVGSWKLDGFIGGRHASFKTDSDLLAFGVFTSGHFVNLTLQNSCGFDGSGVTYGGTVRRQIAETCLHAFGSVRGSHLDGFSDSLGRSAGAVASSPNAPLVGAATVTRNDSPATLAMFDLQLGLELEYALQQIPANCFIRVAYEYQRWNIDGLPTGGAGFGGTIGELTTSSFSSADLGGMTLHGVSIGTGLTW